MENVLLIIDFTFFKCMFNFSVPENNIVFTTFLKVLDGLLRTFGAFGGRSFQS